ncbi:carbonic anhydrase 6-like [Belonocnema kinseyi]|uniref:carbonic anhydrase 6-like n=1 Tax=Belonocnema kinseyi TaxID=2817044 RepID=UPI00143D0978|nr:carbonic anhydrase 6-like [Belonocnema kinseyi]
MQSFGMYQLHLVVTILSCLILGANAFSYKDAKNWGQKYPQCKGKNQSPITIKPPGVMGFPDFKKKPLKLTDFKKTPEKLTIRNNGHTVEMKADWTGEPPSCSGGPLRGKYVFGKATFHWDQKGWNYVNTFMMMPLEEMEMHMYFYRADLKSFDKAETQKDGLAVLSMEFTEIIRQTCFQSGHQLGCLIQTDFFGRSPVLASPS